MNWVELLAFLPLAVLCNTTLPVPFEPVLIFFGAGRTTDAVVVLALLGSFCAGIAGLADIKLLSRAREHIGERRLEWLPFSSGPRFYVLTFLCALLPLPFSAVRLAVLRHRPNAIPYTAAIVLGRFPRYLLMLGVGSLSGWFTH